MHDIVKNCIIVYCESLWWSYCDEVVVMKLLWWDCFKICDKKWDKEVAMNNYSSYYVVMWLKWRCVRVCWWSSVTIIVMRVCWWRSVTIIVVRVCWWRSVTIIVVMKMWWIIGKSLWMKLIAVHNLLECRSKIIWWSWIRY